MANKYAGADWIRLSLGVAEMSPLGERVADVLGNVFQGIYHLPSAALERVEWADPQVIVYRHQGALATWGFPRLAVLVVLCFDSCLRLDIGPCGPRSIELMFHLRERGPNTLQCPTMEDAVERIRGHFALEEVQCG